MTDLGSDFAGISDIDANLSEADGVTAYPQAVARRYLDSGIFYDPEYGKDVSLLLNAGIAPSRERSALETVAKQDERTLTADVDFALDSEGNLTITVELTSHDGPFRLVIDPQHLTAEVLAAG